MLSWSFLTVTLFLSTSKIIKYENKKSGSEPDPFWAANEALAEHEGHLSLANLKSKDRADFGTREEAKNVVPLELQDGNYQRPEHRKSGSYS